MDIRAEDKTLRRLARQLIDDPHLAEDVVQDAWTLLYQQEGRPVEKPGAWLRRTIQKLAHGYRRSRSRRRTRETVAARPEDVVPAQEAIDRASTFDLLRREVLALPAPYTEVLRLCYLDGVPLQEVAQHLDRLPNTIRTQHKRGIELLREKLDRRYDGDRSAWSAIFALTLAEAGEGVTGATASEPAGTGEAAIGPQVGLLRQPVAALLVVVGIGAAGWILLRETRAPEAGEGGRLVAAPAGNELERPTERGSARTPVAPTSSPEAADSTAGTSSPDVPGRVDVKVSDVQGLPIQDAVVRVLQQGRPRVAGSTAADGRLAVELVEADRGGYGRAGFGQRASLTVARDGYVHSSTYHVPYGQDVALPVTLLGPAGRVVGRIEGPAGDPLEDALVQFAWRRAREGPPAPGVLVTPEFQQRRSDAAGRVETGSLPPGRILVHVSCPGLADAVTWAEISPGGGVSDFAIRLREGLTLNGRVTDEDGAPVAGARVWYAMVTRGYEYVTEADADGRFALRNMSVGPAYFGVRGEREDQVRIDYVDLADDGSTEWYPQLGKATGLRFRLVDTEHETQAGWAVRLTGRQGVAMWGRDVETGPDLNVVYDVPDVPLTLAVYGRAPGALPLTSFTDLVARAEPWVLELPADVGAVGALTACVERLPETPVWDGLLTVRGAVGELRQAADAATGCFLVEGLTPGRYELGWAAQDGARFDFGTWELGPSAQLDLGLLREPQRGVLGIRGSTPGANFYELVRDKEFGDNTVVDRLHNGPAPPPELPLYPGTYTLTLYDQLTPLAERRLRIRSNEITHVDLDPGADRRQLVRFVAPAPPTGSFTCRVVRANEPNGAPVLAESSEAVSSGVYEVSVSLPAGTYVVSGTTDDGLSGEAVLDLQGVLEEPVLEVEIRR